MKRTLLYIAFALTLGSFTACDVIDENERYIEVEQGDSSERVQRVLIEEFTGRMCVNCPGGAATVHDIAAAYEGRVVTIGIHAGMFAMPQGPFADMDLRTPEGDTYNEAFPYEGNPAAMFNRASKGGAVVSTNKDMWMTHAISELERVPVCEVTPTVAYDSNSRTATITTEVEAWESMPANISLQVQLTESGIVASQVTEGGLDPDYVHNHVLRKAVNGTWGNNIASLPQGEKASYTHTITLDEAWVAENCHIVVFVYENDTKRVLQCNECAIVGE